MSHITLTVEEGADRRSAQVAALDKGTAEATALREAEKAEFEKASAECAPGRLRRWCVGHVYSPSA